VQVWQYRDDKTRVIYSKTRAAGGGGEKKHVSNGNQGFGCYSRSGENLTDPSEAHREIVKKGELITYGAAQ